MIKERENNSNAAVEASIGDLLRLRPDRNLSGFAPQGKVSMEQFGLNRSVFRGRGMEFDESRIYQPGDDIRTIDWRVTARTGKMHSKLYQEEKERKVYILLDCRDMMHFGTRIRFKSVTGAQIAALLSWIAIDGGDCIGGSVLDQHGVHGFAASRSFTAMLRFFKSICDATHTQFSSVNTQPVFEHAVRRLRRLCHPGTLVFIISDFCDLQAGLEREILLLSQRASVTNIMVYDQLDQFLPTNRDFKISDGISALSLQNINKNALKAYQSAFNNRLKRLERLARHKKIGFTSIDTGSDPKSILFDCQINKSPKDKLRCAA